MKLEIEQRIKCLFGENIKDMRANIETKLDKGIFNDKIRGKTNSMDFS